MIGNLAVNNENKFVWSPLRGQRILFGGEKGEERKTPTMEKQPPPFKVIIIGGSIVGLTLAHCLDHAGIDYVVLEKHQDVDPQLGAFIAILPNGARILEQLGLYDAVKEVSEPTTVHYSVFPDGFISIDYWPTHMKER